MEIDIDLKLNNYWLFWKFTLVSVGCLYLEDSVKEDGWAGNMVVIVIVVVIYVYIVIIVFFG